MARQSGYALEKLGEITNLPTLPSTLQEIIINIQDPNIDFRTLKQIIYRDPPLAARILRIANSAYFGRRDPTSSLETAFLILGLNEVIAIVSSIGVVNAFSHAGSHSFDRRILWKHSLLTGLTSRYFTRKLEFSSRTDGNEFIAGLLHDIGHIIINLYFPDEFGAVLEASQNGANPLEAERELLGNDHAELSGYLAERWRFPSSMTEAMRNHHLSIQPDERPGILNVLRLADRVCSWREGDEPPITPEQLSQPEVLANFFPDSTTDQLKSYANRLTIFPQEFAKIEELSEAML
ncbi:MAG: HDOD domain-containing protein [bacterium]|nr:HDOD domain-containing protein [bacterium]